jgi:hypothetical protein
LIARQSRPFFVGKMHNSWAWGIYSIVKSVRLPSAFADRPAREEILKAMT